MAVAATTGIAVRCHRGRPPVPAGALEIDLGCGPPAALTGVRRILETLGALAPDVVDRASARYAMEWAELHPGRPAPSPSLWDVANSPSERRLHRESEQVFRMLQAASDALVEAVDVLRRPLLLRGCGAADLVSLRGVMRSVERSRAAGVAGLIVCGEWDAPAAGGPMGDRKARLLARLAARMGATVEGEPSAGAGAAARAVDDAPELRHLRAALDAGLAPPERVAAALLAIRACFFSTNYEGSLLACDHALRVLDANPGVEPADVAAAFAARDDGTGTPAIEIDAESLDGPAADLRALLWRSIGVDLSLMGDTAAAMEAFQRALAAGASPLAEATLRMYVGLLLSKRMGRIDDALGELQRGLALVESDPSARAAIAEGWLRNVIALVHFRRRHLRAAYEEEMRALRKVADHHDPSATHLKINVISNLSVLQESAGRREDALRIWRRFREISADWGPNFIKHYAYREGGLSLAAGDEAAAMDCYRRSFEGAAAIGDQFHGHAIASEVAGHHLAAGRGADAARWYGEACQLARGLGDPYRLGQAMAGLALARGDADRAPAAAMLALSTTHDAPAGALAVALAGGDDAAVVALLPRLGGKLNRPFDLVNV